MGLSQVTHLTHSPCKGEERDEMVMRISQAMCLTDFPGKRRGGIRW